MLINLANTGVRQPHDYKVLRLWSPAPQLLIPNSYFLTSSVLAHSGAQSEQTAKYHSCHFSLLSIFPNYSDQPDGAKGGWKWRFDIVNFLPPPLQCVRFVTVQLEGHLEEDLEKVLGLLVCLFLIMLLSLNVTISSLRTSCQYN